MSLKIERAFKKAGIPEMPIVRRHILVNLAKVGADLDKLTSTEIGFIIKALHIGYHNAKGSQEADYMADMGCVWIGGEVQKLLPIEAIKSIRIIKESKPIEKKSIPSGWKYGVLPYGWDRVEYERKTRYKLDFTESC